MSFRRIGRFSLWTIVPFILLIVGSWSAWDVYIDYNQVLEQQYRLLEVRARQRGASVGGSFRSTNLMLGQLIGDIHDHPEMPVASQVDLLTDYVHLLPELHNIQIVNSTGRRVATANGNNIRADVSKREYFRHHLAAPSLDAYYIARPIETTKTIINMTISRSMHDSSGRFQGIVVADLNPEFFSDALKLSVPEVGVEALLINREGDIIANTGNPGFVGRNISSDIAYAEHSQSGQRTTKHMTLAKLDSIKKLSVIHDLGDAPLSVIVTREYDSLLALWRHSMITHIGGFLLLSSTVLLFSWLASRRHAELIQEREKGAGRELVLSAIIETNPECIYQLKADGTLLQINRAGLSIFEADTPQQVLGQPVQRMIPPEYREDFMRLVARVFAGETGMLEFEIKGLNGELRSLETHAAPLRDTNGTISAFLGVARDITERKKMEEQVRQLAFYDPLTALPNRRLLLDRLTQAMHASRRGNKFAALLFLDLDNFKSLNDRHGHAAGDMLLVEVAQRLTACVREIDTVSRIGGDEFVVLLGELDSNENASSEQARSVAAKIQIALMKPYALTVGQIGKPDAMVSHECSASIGVTLFLGQKTEQETILKYCDAAMYQAKKSGRNRVCMWTAPTQGGVNGSATRIAQ